MQSHHDAAHARPTAEWINRYAADLLASAPGMLPLDAVRQAMEAAASTTDERHERAPWKGALHSSTGRGKAS